MSDPTHPTWTLPTRTPSLKASTVLKVMVAAAMACALGWYSYNQAPADKAERQHDPGAIERFQIRNMDAVHALPGGAVRAEVKRIQDLAGREKRAKPPPQCRPTCCGPCHWSARSPTSGNG
jgi:hypothetical protein